MIDPAKPFSTSTSRSRSSAATAKADLTGLLDRARDERFRLLKMLREARAQVEVTVDQTQPAQPQKTTPDTPGPRAIEANTQSAPMPATPVAVEVDTAATPAVAPQQLKDLIAKLSRLDAQLDAKLQRVESVTDEKVGRLEQIDARITTAVQEFAQTMSDGRALHRELATTVSQATRLPTQVTEQLERFEQHFQTTQASEQSAFAEQLQRMKMTLLGEMTTELGQQRARLDEQLAEAHAVAEREIVQRFDQLADSLHERADGILAQTESASDQAMRRIRRQVVDAMARAHDTQEAFKSKLDEHQTHHREHLADLTDTADTEMQVQAQRLDDSMTGLADLFESQADQILTELRDRATTLLDQMTNAAAKLQSDPTDQDDTPDRRAA